jgi:hypothetical protein
MTQTPAVAVAEKLISYERAVYAAELLAWSRRLNETPVSYEEFLETQQAGEQ